MRLVKDLSAKQSRTALAKTSFLPQFLKFHFKALVVFIDDKHP
jgi:hypothetical protein